MQDTFSLGCNQYPFILLGKEVTYTPGINAWKTVTALIFPELAGVDTTTSLAIQERPDGRIDAGVSFFNRLGRQKKARAITADPDPEDR